MPPVFNGNKIIPGIYMSQENTPVYMLIDGERVRKPGDVQDPKRRYRAIVNCQTGESYFQEFTEEEESQADDQTAQWEAEKPIREAEEKQRALDAEKFRESLVYEDRIVAFLDILGWKEAIKKSRTDSELTKHLGISVNNIAVFSDFLENSRQMIGYDKFMNGLQLTQFSDSILISIRADKDCQRNLLWCLGPIVSQLLNLGLFLRGGIAYGKLIHRGAIAYGPALITAIELEQSAVYPRIVLDQALATTWKQGESYYDGEKLLFCDKSWRKDRDGYSFYDFLQPFMAGHFRDNQHFRLFFENVRPKITNNLDEFRGIPKVLMKYAWLASYFNDVLDEYPDISVEKIHFLN